MSDGFSRRRFINSAVAAVAVTTASAALGREAENAAAGAAQDGAVSDEQRRFIEELRAVGTRPSTPADRQAAVTEYMRHTVTDSRSRLDFLGTPSAPGIHALHRSPEFTVINVIWSPRMVLRPHNHNMWATIAVYTGREDNIFWTRRGEVIAAVRAQSLSAREVLELPGDAIHSVVNPISVLTGSIHVYGGDFFAPGRSEWDPQSLREQAWNLEGAVRTFKEASSCFEKGRS